MRRLLGCFLLATSLLTFTGFTSAEEAAKDHREIDIPRAKLPEKIAKAATDAVPGGKIADIDRDIKDGKSTWQIGVDLAGKTIEVMIDDEGKVISKAEIASEKIKLTELPPAVSEGVAKEFPGSKITSAEKLTKGGTVSYEMDVDSQKRTFEVVFSADGKLVSKAQAKEEEEKK